MCKHNPANLYPPTEMSFKSILTFVVFVIVLLASFSFGQELATERQHYTETRNYTKTPEAQYAEAIAANTQAATGVNNVFSVIVALASLVGLIAKEFKDNKKSKVSEADIARLDERIKKLFDYHDKVTEHLGNMGKDIVTLQHSNKVLESLLLEVKDLTKTMAAMQGDISELKTMQKVLLKEIK